MASQQALKMPPILVDESNYGEWENDLEIWELFTDLDVEKWRAAVYLSLTGQTCHCVRSLSYQEIGTENGIKNILERLDSFFFFFFFFFRKLKIPMYILQLRNFTIIADPSEWVLLTF